MGTPGSGRKRTPMKDRFSAEDEALGHIAREAEARLAAKRAARAEARDIRMRELERQQKEENSEKASHSCRSSRQPYLGAGDLVSSQNTGSHRASLCDDGLYKRYSNHPPSEDSYYSSRASSSRSSPVLEERTDKPYSDLYTRPASRNSATPISGNSSRRGSGDTSSLVDPDTSLSELRDIYDLKDQIQDVEGRYMQGLKELKESLAEVEEKYKKAMVSNAQLDNEKNNLIYQVDTLKDVFEEREEQLAEYYRENEEKTKELERQKHMCSVLQHKVNELKESLCQRDELIEKHGLVIIPNCDINHEPVIGAITVVSQEAAQVLESAGEGPLDVRLRKLAGEKEELLSQIKKLKLQLEEAQQKSSRNDNTNSDLTGLENGSDLQLIEMQRDANRQISDFKFKLSKAEQDITTLEQNVLRLEGQVVRYKTAAENAEKVEDELKAEKRKLQRELRTALDRIEEMEMTNSHLVKRLEKMKANRTALLSQQ
ncbi:leucine-rich repeat flightless-interacting protein 2 isoform X12 [Thamnophis elegans]|uniref:leucine-rich repeat flightless-interacting protein 2 isoform X12 n=1 Tax=Thamnophis elegans TaxID=35005 RepID=UPI001378EFAA|nr:leucine-rich repeat flightless-interacting protein 2 isoform X12 [Thamnophis elegans]